VSSQVLELDGLGSDSIPGLSVCLWASCLIFLGHCFLFCRMGIIIGLFTASDMSCAKHNAWHRSRIFLHYNTVICFRNKDLISTHSGLGQDSK
jgi:hypothetical protein